MVTPQEAVDSLDYVVKKSEHVSLDFSVIDAYVTSFVPTAQSHWTKSYPLGQLPNLTFNQNLDFYFLIGSQAFCFWGYPDKWTTEYKGKKLDGWWALVASFHRAIENNIPVLIGNYLKDLTIDQAHQLFAGSPEIPLLPERIQMLRKIGNTLCQKYEGSFSNCFYAHNQTAFSLLNAIASEFDGFDDIPQYKKQPVYFFKKAQLVVSDINELLVNNQKPPLEGMVQLTGHADYKLPALQRKMGILRYNSQLAQLVDSKTEIPRGSEMEVEMRANMLWALKLICDGLRKRNIEMDASTLGGILWVESQTKSADDKPYHLTKTIYY